MATARDGGDSAEGLKNLALDKAIGTRQSKCAEFDQDGSLGKKSQNNAWTLESVNIAKNTILQSQSRNLRRSLLT